MLKHTGTSIVVVITAAFIATGGIWGCAPGTFPVITAQEYHALTADVSRLKKDVSGINYDLKKSSEQTADGKELIGIKEEVRRIKSELDIFEAEARKKNAVLSSDLDEMHANFSQIRGGVEEDQYRRGQLDGSLESLRAEFTAINVRLRDAEQASAGVGEALRKLNDQVDLIEGKVADMDQRLIKTEKSAVAAVVKEKRVEEPTPIPSVLYMEGYQQVIDGDYVAGLETLKRFLSLFPNNEFSDNAQYWVGEAYYARGDWERAVLEFNRVIKDYPEGDKLPAALLKQAFSFERLGAKKEAGVLLKRLIEKYPKSDEAEKAKKQLKGLK